MRAAGTVACERRQGRAAQTQQAWRARFRTVLWTLRRVQGLRCKGAARRPGPSVPRPPALPLPDRARAGGGGVAAAGTHAQRRLLGASGLESRRVQGGLPLPEVGSGAACPSPWRGRPACASCTGHPDWPPAGVRALGAQQPLGPTALPAPRPACSLAQPILFSLAWSCYHGCLPQQAPVHRRRVRAPASGGP